MSTAKHTTQQHSISVHTTPDRVWQAITQPEYTTGYFYGSVIDSTFTVVHPMPLGLPIGASSSLRARF
jgi:uncharacterized protein YndB with AHSA1/START domain